MKKMMINITAIIGVLGGLALINWILTDGPRDMVGTLKTTQRDHITLTYSVVPPAATTPTHRQTVVMLPSLGRSASDFNELALQLSQAGYASLLIEPRGMHDNTGLDAREMTLFELAKDVKHIIDVEQPSAGPADPNIIVLGHAFGNRVARAFATAYPERTAHTILIAAGGKIPIAKRARDALQHSFWSFAPEFWRKDEIRYAFFAGDNIIPDYWVGGWNIATAGVQVKATTSTASELWWEGGSAPILVIQALEDKIAPAAHTSDILEKELGSRVQVVRLENAGHALLPERPKAIAQAILDTLTLSH
ncbi:MAG: alpha/beta hydrolase [Parvibaculaceae bacterium]|nr:alpha/beta hydrolase [Parvibaculaceae bacterium]